MRFLHTMLRVRNLDAALHFYCDLLGLQEVRRRVEALTSRLEGLAAG